jgi:hypothetical protein
MPTCPRCDQPMAVAQTMSIPGIHDKAVRWRCDRDAVEVGGVHPVQLAHLHLGDEAEEDGRRTRIIKLEMEGAELLVFRQSVGADQQTRAGNA